MSTDPAELAVSARPTPPPLQPRCPDCPLCADETTTADGGYACYRCDAWWPEDPSGYEPGEWLTPGESQCEETVKPYLTNTWIPDDDPRKNREYRCLLALGHYKPGESMHANHEMTHSAKGWH